MAATVGGYFSTVSSSSTVWNGVQGDVGREWLIVIHAVSGGAIGDMGSADPGTGFGWPRGAWRLLTQVDAGDGFPKIRVWATHFTDSVARSIKLPVPLGANNHSHLYFVGGQRSFDEIERVFSVGATASATAATSQTAPLYAPDDSGLLIGGWISGGLTNYTALDALTMRAELDGAASTSRTGEQTITAHGPASRTATASAGQPWAAVSIVVRDPGGPMSFPVQPLQGRTELALGANPDADPATWAGLWTDITTDTYLRDGITITRGRGDEASTSQPSTMSLTLNNTAGRYVRLNPTGPYFGLLSKNTPIRCWINAGDGWDLRYTGQVSEWPPRSQGGQIDEHMPIAAAGITRRLAQGVTLHSPLVRRIVRDAATVAYWPLESDTSSGLVGGSTMRVIGELNFSSGDGPPGSAGAMSSGNDGKAFGVVPGMPNTGAWSVSWWINIPADFNASADQSILVDWQTPSGDPAKHNRWLAYVAPGSAGGMTVGAYDDNGNVSTISSPVDLRGRGWTLVTVMASITAGTDTLVMLQLGIPGVAIATVTLPGELPTIITTIAVNGYLASTDPIKGQICHLLVRSEPQQTGSSLAGALVDAGAGYAGERVANRIRRLSGETGVPVVVTGDDGTSEPMGPQPAAPLLDILRDAEATDGGVLYEARDGRLAYQTRAARFNAAVAMTLDYAAGHVAPPLEPTDDDQRSRNDWSISRPDGGSARVTDPASITEIGLYGDSATLNVADDDQLPDQAGWRVHLGTNDDLRYPAITPNLLGRPELIPAWVSLDIGDAAAITNPGRDLPPGTIALFAEGYTETIDVTEWRATMNCSPGAPWRVGVLDDTVLGRLDTDGSQLAAGATANATTISAAVTAGPLWTSDPADTPFDLVIGGEVMTVTAVGQILNPNPTFETDASGWATTNATLTRSNVQAKNGSWSGLLTSGAGTIPRAEATPLAAVTAGQSYLASGWLYTPAAVPAGVSVNVNWYDGSQVYLSTSANTTVPAVGAWFLMDTTFTAPASAAFAGLVFNLEGTPGAGVLLYADDVRLVPVNSYATSPQTLTVTRSVNGIVKAHAAGERVQPVIPLTLSM